MDYDANEFQIQSLQLAAEGCLKVSSVLHHYTLPKFEFDSLQEDLRFDNLVENEVFLQEDNNWIEEYSRGSSGIELSSGAVESRHNNLSIWSEATSTESVDILLKSAGQEEKVVTETTIEQLDTCDESGSLTKTMDPNLNQDDGNLSLPIEHEQSQEAHVSGGKVDNIIDDVVHKETNSLADEVVTKEVPNESVIVAGNIVSEVQVRTGDEDGSLNEKEVESSGMEIDAVKALDNQKNVDEAAAMESDKVSPSESVVDPETKNPSSLVQKETSPDMSAKIDVQSTPLKKCNENQIEVEPKINPNPNTDTGGQEGSKMSEASPICESSEKKVNSSAAEKGQQVDPKESAIEVNKSNDQVVTPTTMESEKKDKQETTKGNPLPYKTTDDVKGNIHPVSSSKATPEEKNNTSADKGPQPMITDSSSTQMKLPEGMTSQTGVKPKPARKPRRKSTTVKADKSSVIQFEEVKSNENTPAPKLPDLNNSTPLLQYYQPFTDNQQVQLRAQILVYGSLISGSPPEEAHMIAAFGPSTGRIWEGVWRSCLERLHLQKSQTTPISNTTTQSPVQNQNKVTQTPMIPLSSPLWGVQRPVHFQPLSPVPHYQSTPVGFNINNPSWLSHAAQWVATSPLPPRFPVTPGKESNTPSQILPGIVTNPPDQVSTDSKRKRKKTSKQITAPLGMVPLLTPNQTDSVTAPVISTFKNNPVSFIFPQQQQQHGTSEVVMSDESLTKVEESKIEAVVAAERAAAAVSHCHGVWSQLERLKNSGLTSDDESKVVSAAVAVAAAASAAKVAAAAAKIASDFAQQAKSMVNVLDSKNSENAVVKAAELAAEAVAHAGKVVAMSEPFSLSYLVEMGLENYWKTPKEQHLIDTNQKNLLEENQEVENKKRKPRVRKGRGDVAKTQSEETSVAGQTKPEAGSDALKDDEIKEGVLVEVYKEDDKYNGAWFGAHVLSLNDGKALVSYVEIKSKEGQLEEWVALEDENNDVPKIRVAHPLTLMHLEGGNKKRSRTAVKDFVWFSGDLIDVWIKDRWREGVVLKTNETDPTSLTVKYLGTGKGETSIVRTWFVRPTLFWKDGKWVECHTSSQGDTPQEKRKKLETPIVDKEEKVVELNESTTTTTLPLLTQEATFSVGNTRKKEKEGTGVVFGVPKPGIGKKQKFMDVSKHYVGDESNKNNHPPPTPSTTTTTSSRRPTHDSVKFTKYLIPQAPSGMKNKEKQAVESKPRMQRKPPVPSFRTLASSKSTTKTTTRGSDDNQSDQEFDADVALPVKKVSTRSERVNKRKFVAAASEKEAVKEEKPVSEHVEPSRRSNRKIQPTARLLEGLQSSMTISKLPAASHFTHTKRQHE